MPPLKEKSAPYTGYQIPCVAPPDSVPEDHGDGLFEIGHVAAGLLGVDKPAHQYTTKLLRGGGGLCQGIADDVIGVVLLPVVHGGVHFPSARLVGLDGHLDAQVDDLISFCLHTPIDAVRLWGGEADSCTEEVVDVSADYGRG